MVELVCKECGAAFTTKPYMAATAVACSAGCRGKVVGRMNRRPIEDRFWNKVERGPSKACWPWMGARTFGGYGVIGRGKDSLVRAHRLSWEFAHGPIPDGLVVLHTCDNPPCVNPGHLALGTQRANMRDAKAKGRSRGAARKLNDDQIASIRLRAAAGEVKLHLAREFGVSRAYITMITTGQRR